MTLTNGNRLGPYEVTSPLGAGGMGEVYRAHDTRLDRDVAIKVLPAAFAQDPDRLARFEREARAVAALSHPNILAIHDVGTHAGQTYVVTELLDGETLRARLTEGALPVRKTIDTAVQIARGLAAAHEKAIVHRDLKPENVFLLNDGQVKILDFGLARHTPTGSGATGTAAAITGLGVVMGTAGYMAPEQVRGHAVDARADLFAFGAVLYEMLSGNRAFKGDTAADTMSAILKDDPPDLTGSSVAHSPALDRIIRHCLEKNPSERFQTARDVAFALEALAGTSTGTSGSASIPAASTPPPGRASVLAAVLVVVALAVGVVVGQRMATGHAVPPVFEQKTFARQHIPAARFMPDSQTIVYERVTNWMLSGPLTLERSAAETTSFTGSDLLLRSVSAKGELAVTVDYLGKSTLARMSLGSAPRAIADYIGSADWAPDGVALAVVRNLRNGRMRLEYPIGNSLYEAPGSLSDIRVSPDGSRVAFMEHPWANDDRGWVKVVDRSREAITLAGEFASEAGLAWTPDGTHVVYSASQTTGYSAARSVAATDPSTDRPVMTIPGVLWVMDIARDGRWLVAQSEVDFAIAAHVPGQADERDLSWMNRSLANALSKDGQQLLLADMGPGGGLNYATALRKTDGSPVTRLGEGTAQALSPDGKWAAALRTTAPHLILYPTGTGDAITIPEGPLEQYQSAQWFPDGQSLLIAANEAGKPARLYQQPISSAPPVALADPGIYAGARLAPTGHSVIARDEKGRWEECFFDKSRPRTVSTLHDNDNVLAWSNDSRSVFVSVGRDPPWHVERVDLATGARAKVRDLGPVDRAGLISLWGILWVDDGHAYTYSYQRYLSTLFVVTGVQRD